MAEATAPVIHAPVIGISGSSAESASVRAMMTQIAAAGAVPMFLGNHSQRNPAEDIQRIDSLIVMGNDNDIDPARYGQARHAKTKSERDTPEGIARCDYEDDMLKLAVGSKMPVLGVCAGMQRIDTLQELFPGGELHQHIPELTGHDEHAQQALGIAPFTPVQAVTIAKDSKLGGIAEGISAIYTPARTEGGGNIVVNENSMHHQAVAKVGAGLRAAAYSDDTMPDGGKLIEAIEADPTGPYKDQFIVGVQFHPEFSASPLGAKLATALAGEAKAYAKAHGAKHNLAEVLAENFVSQQAKPGLKLHQEPEAPPQGLQDVLKIRQGGMVEMVLRQREQQQNSVRQAG